MQHARHARLLALRELLKSLRGDLLLRDVAALGIARIDAFVRGDVAEPTLHTEMADLLPRLDQMLALIERDDLALRSSVTSCVRLFEQRTTGKARQSRRERWLIEGPKRAKERVEG